MYDRDMRTAIVIVVTFFSLGCRAPAPQNSTADANTSTPSVRNTEILPGVGAQRAKRAFVVQPRIPDPDQLKRTYSKSIGWVWMPRRGGAIQLANLPGSTTRPLIIACTKV
jgi:hypothetical protein